MPYFVCLLALALLHAPSERLTVIDMNLVQPLREVSEFGVDSYFKRQFPIHSTDVQAVATAAKSAAKLLDSKKDFGTDSLLRGATAFVIAINFDEGKTITVRITTFLEHDKAVFSFDLLRREGDRRKAQRKLIEFAAYLQNE